MLTDYLKILGLTGDDATKIIDEMEGGRAKEILKVVVAIWNEEREKPTWKGQKGEKLCNTIHLGT